jgi:predicted nucleic acid-binding protein
VVPVDQELAEMAGAIKAHRKMSLADCFAAALAKHRKAEVYTGDPEFRAMEGEIRIVWI